MEQQGVQVDRITFSCSICLDLLKDPVTVPCGHSYCRNCITTNWNQEAQKGIYSCPQCRKTFMPRPVLEKNTMLATVVEQLKTGLYSPPEGGPEDVPCDFCTGRKLKTIKSCLGHDTVSAAAERTERRELEVRREEIQQRIQDREKDVKLLQQEVEAINHSADKTVEDSEKIFTELIRLIQKRSSDVKQQIRSQQETKVSRVKELQEKLEQEITELKRKDAELKQLSNTEDHNQFLHNYPSLSALSESTHSSSINIRPLRYFEDVTAAVSELRDKLQDILRDTWTKISPSAADGDLKTDQEPKSRTDYLRYSCPITLDPNTAHTQLKLSEGNRKVTLISQHQSYSSRPDRFTGCCQVLSRESLTGRCYWEVKWRGRGGFVAVSYKNISRTGGGSECAFGHNDKSWALDCYQNRYTFFHKKIKTSISGPGSSRVGVYLDHRAGLLSFYSVSETMTLLHRVQTTFTQPLHAGVWVYYTKDTAEFCKLR